MEILLRKVRSEALPDRPAKDIYLCRSAAIGTLAGQITPSSQNFGLLLVMDAQSVDVSQIGELAENLASKGLAYLCTWGPDCERVHDIFDEILVQRDLEQKDENIVMTTWHADDSLEETLWYFMNCAFPARGYEGTCEEWIVVAIGNAEWEQRIRAVFEKLGTSKPESA